MAKATVRSRYDTITLGNGNKDVVSIGGGTAPSNNRARVALAVSIGRRDRVPRKN
jgi:hypothetical protein